MPHTLYDSASIRSLFDEMSATYGVANLIASFGFAARWRHLVVKKLPVAPSSHIEKTGLSRWKFSLPTYWNGTLLPALPMR